MPVTKKSSKTVSQTATFGNAAPKAAKKHSVGFYLAWSALGLGIVVIAGLIYSYYYYTSHKTLARFDGGKITRSEFVKVLQVEASKFDPLAWKNPEESLKIKKNILQKLIQEKILLAKAKKFGVKINKDELNANLNSFKSGYTEDTFRDMLTLQGISYDDWSQTKQNKFIVQKLIEDEVINKIETPAEEIKLYYKEHNDEFTHPEQVRARHILVTNWDDAVKIADELNSGANFAALAKEKSISPERWKGGDLGYFSRGTHPEVFDLICFNLPVGEMSQVVKSEYGYHIFKVIDKRGPAKETLEEATPYIITQLKSQKSDAAFRAWLEPILAAANAKINDDMLGKVEVSTNE